MLISHSFQYLIARGLPGIISFAALMIYTRLLTTEEFGVYSLIVTGASLVQVMLFQWLHLVLARFLPLEESNPKVVLESILALFLSLSGVTLAIGFVAAAFVVGRENHYAVVALAVALCISQGWLEISLKLASTQMQPKLFGKILFCKTASALLLGGTFAWLGLTYFSPVLGLICGGTLAWLAFGYSAWKGVVPKWPPSATLSEYARYGFPLAITFALLWVTSSSDRIMLSWLVSNAATGVYSASYDLAQQSLGLLLAVVNTAAYPLVMRALVSKGDLAAKQQLATNGELIVSVALTSAAGTIALTPYLVSTVIGSEFRSEAINVLPWIAASAAVAGIKAFHLDIAFQLSRQSKMQAYVAAGTAIANVALNLLLIPLHGVTGAAIATLLSFLLAGTVSWWIGQSVFPMPPFYPLVFRGSLVAIPTYIGIKLVNLFSPSHVGGLVIGAITGITIAVTAALLLNIAEVRTKSVGE